MTPDEMPVMIPVVTSKKFVNQIIVLDGTQFDKCEFEHCVLIYRGGFHGLSNCTYIHPTWRFEGAANRTVDFLREVLKMYPEVLQELLPSRTSPKVQ